MSVVGEVKAAFRVGVVNASTARLKASRWLVLVLLWGASSVCIVLSVVAFIDGVPLTGASFLLSALAFGFLSLTAIVTAATSERIARRGDAS